MADRSLADFDKNSLGLKCEGGGQMIVIDLGKYGKVEIRRVTPLEGITLILLVVIVAWTVTR